MFASLAALLLAASATADGRTLAAACQGKDGWTDPAPPVQVFGNVYDVGTCGITVLLVTSDAGHILIDAGPAEAAPLVAANIARLGFRIGDVRYILTSHEHDDHVGGIARLQRLSGATLVARTAARRTLESGVADPADPQAAVAHRFAGARVGRSVADGARVRLGKTAFTAHATTGHAPRSTSWSWRSCERRRCLDLVYADSLTSISGDRYRYADHPAYVAAFRRSIATVAALPCDVLLTPHPGASHLFERLAGAEPLVDRDGCRRYADGARRALDARLAKEAR